MTEHRTQESAPARRSLRDFAGETVWADLLEHSFERRHPAGSVLLRQGESGTHVLAVVTGVAKVIRQERNGDLSLLAFRGPGELLGEVAVLDDGVRSANVESISQCVVGVMGKAEFLAFVSRHSLFPVLVRYALTRLRESDEARGGGDVRARLATALVHLIDIS
ncbi:Crp/Fnr family transcriptional regulator [Streptomyces sp. NPDC014344]